MTRINRRQFLAAAATSYSAAWTVQAQAASSPLKLGLIGCGGFGVGNLIPAVIEAAGAEFVALCDIDTAHLNNALDALKDKQAAVPKTFKDYREMLDSPGLQAVIIATPPHWHALPFIAACEKGLDIYCEKPLAYDVREGRAMVEAARKHNCIVQVGFQRRQNDVAHAVRDYIRQGRAGRIVQAECHINFACKCPVREPKDPPATLDWDLWCGPAPLQPYSEAVGHRFWRYEKTTGNGHLVDWGIHMIDLARFMLDEGAPLTVQAAGGLYELKKQINTPDILTVHYEFARCPLTWRHRMWGAAAYQPENYIAIILYGEKETIVVTDEQWHTVPEDKNQTPIMVKSTTFNELRKRHMADWLDAVRTRKPPCMPVEEGYKSTLLVQLGAIACEVGRKITWDAEKETIPDDPAAALLKREYRAPWKHPYTS